MRARIHRFLSVFGVSENVYIMGAVSLFNDISSEMIYPLIPIFLTSVLGAPVAIFGFIEGIAQSIASILQVFSGWLSDKFNARKPFVVLGYSLSSVSKILFTVANHWIVVLFARSFDRLGKGIRTTPRDALIAESSGGSVRGRSFGLHRTLDTLGAVIGPLLSILLLAWLGNNYRLIFFCALIPGLIAVLLLVIGVREVKPHKHPTKPFIFSFRSLDPAFVFFLVASIIFALGNSSEAFIILRAQDLGLNMTSIMLAYILSNLAYAFWSTPAGIISDNIGPKKVLVTGFILFGCVYAGFGYIHSSLFIWLLFPLYGLYQALTDGVGKAYIAQSTPSETLATTYGIYQTTIGLCTFFASFFAGILWTYVDSHAPFYFGSAMAIFAAIFLLFVHPAKK